MRIVQLSDLHLDAVPLFRITSYNVCYTKLLRGADHNSLIARVGQLYFQTIKKFVEKSAGLAPDWRERRRQFRAQQTLKKGVSYNFV